MCNRPGLQISSAMGYSKIGPQDFHTYSNLSGRLDLTSFFLSLLVLHSQDYCDKAPATVEVSLINDEAKRTEFDCFYPNDHVDPCSSKGQLLNTYPTIS